MAATDLIKVRPIISQTVNGQTVSTNGVEELRPVSQVLGEAAGFVAAAPVPFTDLTQAATYFNNLRTALIAAGVLKPTA